MEIHSFLKKGGKLPLSPKDKSLRVRLSDEEFAQLETAASIAGFQTISAYVRYMTIGDGQDKEIKLHYYQFRKLPPSIMREKGQQFNNVYRLWLGHCEGVTEIHCVGNGETTLDRCIQWLHGQLFGEDIDTAKEIEEIGENSVDEQGD